MIPPAKPRLTIAICTWNRAGPLALVFADLIGQASFGDGDLEVLVVNNRSTDETASMLEAWSDRLPLRSVVEERQGTVYARNRALAEARGDIMIFLDDDIRLRPNWLTGYRILFSDPALQAAAGPVISTWPEKVPDWIGDTDHPPFPGVTVHFVPGNQRRLLGLDGEIPFTANLGFRTASGRAIGFTEGIGHVGGKAMGGDDMDFCRRFIARFGPILYDPAPTVEHPVEPRRLALRHTFGYIYRGAIAEAWYSPPAGARKVGPVPLWIVGEFLRSIPRAAVGAVRADARAVVVACGRIVSMAGLTRGLLTNRPGS